MKTPIQTLEARKHRVTGTVLGLMAACVIAATSLTLTQIAGLELDGGLWQAPAPLIALYELGGKAGVAALFLATGAFLATLCRKELTLGRGAAWRVRGAV